MCSCPTVSPSAVVPKFLTFLALSSRGCFSAFFIKSLEAHRERRILKSMEGAESSNFTCGAAETSPIAELLAACASLLLRMSRAYVLKCTPSVPLAVNASTWSREARFTPVTSCPRTTSSSRLRKLRCSGDASQLSPRKTTHGFDPSRFEGTVWVPPPSGSSGCASWSSASVVASSIPSSHMSSKWPSNILPTTKLLGRFLEWEATVNSEQSFFWHKNSRLEASSNGCMLSFFRLSILPNGLRSENSSFRDLPTSSEVLVPRMKRTDLVFSTTLGAAFLMILAARAEGPFSLFL
mmetsp:Transcript_37046/g.63003  ORF Transcript_37046/g.63003 Transcript_37046/m.63003 type:complete len:294 (+) Transcript_37046:469-1350(+)